MPPGRGTISLTQVGRDLQRHPKIDREFWQHKENESVRWTDPLVAQRWWSKWSDGEGEPFWLNDFTQETVTEEPLNANWSVTLRTSESCDDDGSILGVIRHPVANGCYPLDGGGQIDLGSGSDPDSFRYKGSFTYVESLMVFSRVTVQKMRHSCVKRTSLKANT